MFFQKRTGRPGVTSSKFSSVRCDALDTEAALAMIGQRDADAAFGYVVFPSAAFLADSQRYGSLFGMACEGAWLSLCSGADFRQVARRQGIEVAAFSLPDFVSLLLARVIEAGQPVNLVGASPEAATMLRERYRLERLAEYAVPANINESSTALAECLEFCRAHPARFTLLAAETPRQELLAAQIAGREGITGLGLCLGGVLAPAAAPGRGGAAG